ncbi:MULTISPECIES: hypothetical protein [Flavobacteriaceae]|uniref:hypothetical protein n=1 Tax=Flavobacteriaceae TaxID=49546 RepID=UPI001492449A|nr:MULTISPECIES: hypothetical protein [Allomuricauda]MDC6365744.1 hypothetical protein [Muricauda sp. AC10]
MSERPTRIELVKILIDDRNHHFSHPHNVAVKFFYSFGGTISTVLIALFLKNQIPLLKDAVSNSPQWFMIFGILTIIGYIPIFWGLVEHTTLHMNQRKRVESAIEYLVKVKPEEFDFNLFWIEFGRANLEYRSSKKSKNSTNLIVAEPDSRNWLNYHDRKIELGILMILIGVIGLVIGLFI